MKELVVIGKNTGKIGIAIPLYYMEDSEQVSVFPDYVVSLTKTIPVAYVLFADDEHDGTLINAQVINKYCEFLGDL